MAVKVLLGVLRVLRVRPPERIRRTPLEAVWGAVQLLLLVRVRGHSLGTCLRQAVEGWLAEPLQGALCRRMASGHVRTRGQGGLDLRTYGHRGLGGSVSPGRVGRQGVRDETRTADVHI